MCLFALLSSILSKKGTVIIMQDSGNFSKKQEQALLALVTSNTIREAAAQVKINEVTIYRWLKQEDFQRAHRELRREAIRLAISKLQRVTCEAIEVLAEVMRGKENLASARVSAAKTILESAFKASEMDDMLERIEDLERRMEEAGEE